jgi:hypothetical protein
MLWLEGTRGKDVTGTLAGLPEETKFISIAGRLHPRDPILLVRAIGCLETSRIMASL